MKAALIALAAGLSPVAATAQDGADSNAMQCELTLAIWTQFWNEAPRRSFLLASGAAELLNCAWNEEANAQAPGMFSSPTLTEAGNVASLQMSRDYGGHSNLYHCRLAREGDYWRLVECEIVGIGDAAF